MPDEGLPQGGGDAISRRGFAGLAAGAGLIATLPRAALGQQPAGERRISGDITRIKGPTSSVWRRCVGAGRVGELRYAAAQQQLRDCKAEFGFEYLRCHGLFHDELGVYRKDKAGRPIYNFQYVDLVYDFLISIGVRPFVEFGFMPEALATIPSAAAKDGSVDDPQYRGGKRRVDVFQWRANVTPPRDRARWADLVTAITRHWIERYGRDEVRTWWFEIWNEPNLPAFWSPDEEGMRQAEYFALYKATADAVKAVDPALRVGGPAAAGPNWTSELIAFCAQNKVAVDFISFHAYGLGGGASGLDEFGDDLLYLNRNIDAVARYANSQFDKIAQSARPGLPVHVTEWSASYSSRDPVHDDYLSAPFILEQLRNTERVASMSYWTYTDLFEEMGVPPRAFHGGFGLLNMQGIRKPAFYAYRYRARLGAEELANDDPRSWLCRSDNGGVQALFWDMTLPPLDGPNQTVFRQLRPSRPVAPVTLSVAGLRPGRYRLRIDGVGYERNDAYSAWLKMGAPANLSFAQVAALKAVAGDRPLREALVRIGPSGLWQERFAMRERDVMLATLTPA